MPRESCSGLLLTLVSVVVGLCESSAIGGATSSAQQQQQQQQHQQQQQQQQQQHPVCKPGLEFWSADRAACWPCTRCAPEFTLSPCAVHKDAICGPLSALELDWSFLSPTRRKPGPPEATEAASQRRQPEEAATSKTFWRFSADKRTRERFFDEAGDLADLHRESNDSWLDEEPVSSASPESKTAHDPRERRKPTAGEDNLLWDWQTGALVLAVCACIVFFLVAGCSALVYARQWRRMKKNFEPAGLEEISARLNLMVKAELAELVAGAPMNPGDPETRCQYLEKLLDRKWETPVVAAVATAAAAAAAAAATTTTTTTTAAATGTAVTTTMTTTMTPASGNLYIEEGSTMTPRSKRSSSQIARIQRNIETILSQKNPGVD